VRRFSLHCKNGSGKTTIMSIINGLEESDTGQVVLKTSKWHFVSKQNLQEELTIEESILS
jgi:ATP-binding cassette subfamily F protein uup